MFHDPHEVVINTDAVQGLTAHLVGRAWGAGRDVLEAYDPEAKARITQWGNAFFNPLMRSTALEAESLKRLHTYSHIISLLYAWSEQCPEVLLRHVEAAITATSISRTFVERLIGQNDIEVPKFKQYQMSLERKIVNKVSKEPGIGIKKLGLGLRGSGTYQDVTELARRLAKENGELRLVKRGRAEYFFLSEVASEVAKNGE